MNNKIILTVIVLLLIGLGAYYFSQQQDQTAQTPEEQTTDEQTDETAMEDESMEPADPADVPAQAVARFDTSAGTFDVTLNGEVAPQTVANFIELSENGFYEGTKFHRIVAGFMIQAGDPNSKDDDPANDGQGGPGYTVPAEINLNHTTGAIAMARLPDQVNPSKASSGSQFYIVLEENISTQSLNGNYTVFGQVTSGMDVITAIGATPVEINPFTGEQSVPLTEVVINSITILEASNE